LTFKEKDAVLRQKAQLQAQLDDLLRVNPALLNQSQLKVLEFQPEGKFAASAYSFPKGQADFDWIKSFDEAPARDPSSPKFRFVANLLDADTSTSLKAITFYIDTDSTPWRT
jgi:hypothetical protein